MSYISIDINDIKESELETLVKKLNDLNHNEEGYKDQEEFINDHLGNCDIYGDDWEPYVGASGPSYSSGGQPAEGGFFHKVLVELYDLDIRDLIVEKKLESINESLSEKEHERLQER